MIYGGQDWLPAWAAAGFLAPLDDVAPEKVAELKQDLAPFALSDVTYNGKVYGLPYYADTISLLYNKKILADAGIPVPQTWEEMTAAAEKLKAGGMEFPIAYEYNAELPNFYDQFIAGVYSRGGDMFDADLNPLFADPDSAAFKQLAVDRRHLRQGAGLQRDPTYPTSSLRWAPASTPSWSATTTSSRL